MDKVTRDLCVAQLKNADEHPEKPELMRSAIVSSMIAVVDCQYSTGKRVKRLVICVAVLMVIIVSMLLFGPKDTVEAINFVRGN